MNFILVTTLIGLLAGVVGTSLGGIITLFWRKPSDKSVSFLLGLAGGVMFAIVAVDLFPQAVKFSNIIYALCGIGLGLLLLKLAAVSFKSYNQSEEYIQTGILLGLGIAIHNFPEGLAIGAGYLATVELGFGLAVVMALHNLPEGLSMAMPMNVGGWKPIKIIIATILPGIPMGFGAFCGAVMGHISPTILSVTLGFAGGGMLYIVLFELIPDAYSFRYGLYATSGLLTGGLLGVVLTLLI